jgi:hypothetical protein
VQEKFKEEEEKKKTEVRKREAHRAIEKKKEFFS